MDIPLVDLEAQFRSVEEEMVEAIYEVIEDCAFVGGPYLERFEEEFADYVGTRNCVGVNSGTDALHVALECLGVGAGDEVIVPANSFVATAEAVTMSGAEVVFADCQEELYTVDPGEVAAKVTERTKAIIPVHLFGQPADMDAISEIAESNDLFVIEDAAQAHGSDFRGRSVGTLGDCACFSFYPGKNLGAYGDGGALVTEDASLAEKARMYSDHGRSSKYGHVFEGINSRLDGLQAAVLSVKLRHLEAWTQHRREVAREYDRRLSDEVVTPARRVGSRHVFHLYVVRVSDRDEVKERLSEEGISAGIHYPKAIPYLEAYRDRGHTPEEFPVAHRYQSRLLSLPMHGQITDDEIEYVADTLNEVLARRA